MRAPRAPWASRRCASTSSLARLGLDTDERTIPHEVGWIGAAVHLSKGCYRGQETVARVQNMGRALRRLVRLHLDGSTDRPATGDPVLAGGRTVGRLGTVVDHVDDGSDRAGSAQARAARGHGVGHRGRGTGGRGDRRGFAARQPTSRVLDGSRWTGCGGTITRRGAADGPASGAQPGTVKCWQDNKDTQIGAAF